MRIGFIPGLILSLVIAGNSLADDGSLQQKEELTQVSILRNYLDAQLFILEKVGSTSKNLDYQLLIDDVNRLYLDCEVMVVALGGKAHNPELVKLRKGQLYARQIRKAADEDERSNGSYI